MCWYCGSPISDKEPIGRSLQCSNCKKDLRSCKNCRFFLPGTRGDCSETAANTENGMAADKERANFCDWFSLNPKYRETTDGQKKEIEKANAAKTAFDNLFS